MDSKLIKLTLMPKPPTNICECLLKLVEIHSDLNITITSYIAFLPAGMSSVHSVQTKYQEGILTNQRRKRIATAVTPTDLFSFY